MHKVLAISASCFILAASTAHGAFLTFPTSMVPSTWTDVSGITIEFSGSYSVNHPAFIQQDVDLDGTIDVDPWNHVAMASGSMATITVPATLQVNALLLYDVDDTAGLEIVEVSCRARTPCLPH